MEANRQRNIQRNGALEVKRECSPVFAHKGIYQQLTTFENPAGFDAKVPSVRKKVPCAIVSQQLDLVAISSWFCGFYREWNFVENILKGIKSQDG